MRLAAHLGCTVGELLDRTTSRELSEWVAYDAMDGLHDWRVEWLLAGLLALLSNVYRDPDASALTPMDFLPWLRRDEPEPEPVDLAARIVELNALFGGADLRGRNDDTGNTDG